MNKVNISEKDKESKDSKDSKDPNSKIRLFSDYGYVEVKKVDYEDKSNQHIHIEKSSIGLQGIISKQSLTETITVNLKTLYGSRKVYAFQVDVKDHIRILIDKLIEQEQKNEEKQKWSRQYQYRLISTNGIIKELDASLSFSEEEIKNNFTLILASPYAIFFSDKLKHTGIQVS
jgi:hypothetical protein